jgi:hypothetical protein
MVNLSRIRVAFGERIIFNDEDFLLRPGDKVGLGACRTLARRDGGGFRKSAGHDRFRHG